MKLFIDIETIPSQKLKPEDMRDRVKVPANYKKPETIEQYIQDNLEHEWRRTALDGTWGEICVIGWAIDDGGIVTHQRELGGNEGQMLAGFFDTVANMADKRKVTQWVAHNGCGFDFRFIWQRCVINGIRPPITIPHNAKPWSPEVFDTLYEWKGDNRAGGSLDNICKAFGLEGKGDIDGSKVWDHVRGGKIDEVAAYCRDDVYKLREIYNRMTFNQ